MYLLNRELQEKSKTFADCSYYVFQITQEKMAKEFQVKLCRSVILSNYKHMHLFQREIQNQSETFRKCHFYVFKKTKEI